MADYFKVTVDELLGRNTHLISKAMLNELEKLIIDKVKKLNVDKQKMVEA